MRIITSTPIYRKVDYETGETTNRVDVTLVEEDVFGKIRCSANTLPYKKVDRSQNLIIFDLMINNRETLKNVIENGLKKCCEKTLTISEMTEKILEELE